MMDFNLFFDQFETGSPNFPGGLSKEVRFNMGPAFDWQQAELAIVGVDEYRGVSGQNDGGSGLFAFRQAFYALQPFAQPIKIADMGNIRPGPSLSDTYLRIKEVCSALMEQNVLPVVVGGAHDLAYGQYMAYENLDKIVSLLNVDARFDLDGHDSGPHASFLSDVLLHHPNYLFEYAHLGYQRPLTSPKVLHTFEKLNFEARSLGEVRADFEDTEPFVRGADMLVFDLAAVRAADAPSVLLPNVFGLGGEEACQLCWYAGLSDKLSSVGFYGLDPRGERLEQTAQLLAGMLWYFVEGFAKRSGGHGFNENFHVKYIVPFNGLPGGMVFYKSRHSGKWWLEVPLAAGDGPARPLRNQVLVPCSYQDYESATQGNLPDRWVKAQEKYS